VNVLQMLFKFRPREAGFYTQYWQLSAESLGACADTACTVVMKFELCGKVSIFDS